MNIRLKILKNLFIFYSNLIPWVLTLRLDLITLSLGPNFMHPCMVTTTCTDLSVIRGKTLASSLLQIFSIDNKYNIRFWRCVRSKFFNFHQKKTSSWVKCRYPTRQPRSVPTSVLQFHINLHQLDSLLLRV